jgi:hypothetical protein
MFGRDRWPKIEARAKQIARMVMLIVTAYKQNPMTNL